MGLLVLGEPLSWEESKQHQESVRAQGVSQLLDIYHRLGDRKGDCLKFGEEIEAHLLVFDHERRRVRLSLRAEEILHDLTEDERNGGPGVVLPALWRPEFGSWMVESTPGAPYDGQARAFSHIEKNMQERRREIRRLLGPNEHMVTLTNFMDMGVDDFTSPAYPAGGPVTQSLYVPDALFAHHPRFPSLARSIRERRGKKVDIRVPVYPDARTTEKEIHMDAMAFGMGMACLQVTFQASSIAEARLVYDPLAVLCPILLALTAATPVFRGMLSDVDVRWGVISASVDDRTDEEKTRIKKSRYDSVSNFLGPSQADPALNDLNPVTDAAIERRLLDAGMEPALAHHFAHIMIRDSLVVFRERLNLEGQPDQTDHFEGLQSTNWQTMRFKPPPLNSDIGWRVEFRPMEVQFTDKENAAFTVFVVLITRVILSYGLHLCMPLSKVDENMKRAHARNAVLDGRFHWLDGKELSIKEIVSGGSSFAGLMPLIRAYLANIVIDLDTRILVDSYLNLVEDRANGNSMTNAAWIRDRILKHPEYKGDSVVSHAIVYDITKEIASMEG